MKKYTCQCCGYMTLDEKSGNYDICPICLWEDDWLQNKEYDTNVGANSGFSLRQAQKNFKAFGVYTEKHISNVRKPTKLDKRDPNWKPIREDAPHSDSFYYEAGIQKPR